MKPADWLALYTADSPLHRIDPRARILAALWLAAAVLSVHTTPRIAAALIAGLALMLLARIPLRHLLYRVGLMAGLTAMLTALLPVQVAVTPTWSVTYDPALIGTALPIAGRASAILFILTALVGTIEPAALGHALAHLRVPARLVQLYLFTIRYLDVLRREGQTLHTAMRARGYAPALNRTALRATGHLVGMLLVRSLDRSEAIVRAMKCRGEHGAFHLFRHFHYHRRDAVFALLAAATGLLLITGWPTP